MHSQGLHLIEVVIVLCIISILSALCIPLYSQYMVAANRKAAAIILANTAIKLEEYAMENESYARATLKKIHVPNFTSNAKYRLALNNTDHYFTVSAIPLGKQAIADKECGILSINSYGEKKISGNANPSLCW